MESVDTSGKALVEFWKRAGDKGELNPHTANALRAASAQVLTVVEGWETVDVRTLDAPDVFRRYANKDGSKLKQASLLAYSKRWPIAVRSFLEYATDPTTWKPPVADRPVMKGERPTTGSSPANHNVRETPAETSGRATAVPPASGFVEYPFPLREGRLAYLKLPVDLKAAEVKRLTAFLNTLAVDADISE